MPSHVSFLVLLMILSTEAVSDSSNSRMLSRPGSYPVGKQDFELIDTERTTAFDNKTPETPGRRLKTTVWYPARERPLEWLRSDPKPIATEACPGPLIVYSHGFMSYRKNDAYLARQLASHGYWVVAADFPLTRLGTPGGQRFDDVVNQPGDVSFLIDTLLAWSGDPRHRFVGCVDPQRIGAMGLSLGGMTTTLLAFHPQWRDPRIGAAVSIAGPTAMFHQRFFATSSAPLLVIAGDIDAMVDYSTNVAQLQDRAPSTTIVTLRAGSHTGFAGIAASLFRWLDNPDSIGCWAIRRSFDGQRQDLAGFLENLGGDQAGIRPIQRPNLCNVSPLPTALRPHRQQQLTALAVLAFLQSKFHPRESMRTEYSRLLEQTLPRENTEMQVKAPISDQSEYRKRRNGQ